jgi:hypothetical protein
MTRSTAVYLGASAALVTALALVRPTPPPSPPAEDAGQAVAAPTDPPPDVPLLRIAARRRLAAEVIDGRRSVFAAAALFRELDRMAPTLDPPRPDRGVVLPVAFPAATEDERYCLHVTRWTYIVLRDESPARAVEVTARLAAEVRAEAQARGSVRLPDPAALEPVDRLLAEARAALPR